MFVNENKQGNISTTLIYFQHFTEHLEKWVSSSWLKSDPGFEISVKCWMFYLHNKINVRFKSKFRILSNSWSFVLIGQPVVSLLTHIQLTQTILSYRLLLANQLTITQNVAKHMMQVFGATVSISFYYKHYLQQALMATDCG